MNRWVVASGDVLLFTIKADPATGEVTIQAQTVEPVAITPDMTDDLRNKLGLAAGVARGGQPGD